MPELETVEIKSWKNPNQCWVINQVDYDPAQHQLWGDVQAMIEDIPQPVVEAEPEHEAAIPSVPDFEYSATGDILTVNVINPERGTARLRIAAEDYNPDVHQLWSTHSRFQR